MALARLLPEASIASSVTGDSNHNAFSKESLGANMCAVLPQVLVRSGHLIAVNYHLLGFPDGSDGKGSACNAGETRGLIPESGRSPGEGNGYPLQYS